MTLDVLDQIMNFMTNMAVAYVFAVFLVIVFLFNIYAAMKILGDDE